MLPCLRQGFFLSGLHTSLQGACLGLEMNFRAGKAAQNTRLVSFYSLAVLNTVTFLEELGTEGFCSKVVLDACLSPPYRIFMTYFQSSKQFLRRFWKMRSLSLILSGGM